jgi:hypothetical protein
MKLQASRHQRMKASRGRRSFALIDVIVGSIMLAVGLAVIITSSSRSLSTQIDGEKQLAASWIADELLSMVVVEGPVNYPKLYDTAGACEAPYEDFDYELVLEDLGPWEPFRVTAYVRWPSGNGHKEIAVQTLIADRGGDPEADPPVEQRLPKEVLDRNARYFEESEENEE